MPRQNTMALSRAVIRMNRLNALAIAMLSVFIVVAAISAVFASRAVSESNERVENALMLREMARTTYGHVQAAERGQRGFLLTEKQEYLAPYLEAHAFINSDFAELRELVGANPELERRLQELERIVSRKFSEMRRSVEVARDGDFPAARRLIEADIGLGLMNRIDDAIGEMIAESTSELNRRQEQSQGRTRLLTGLIFVALLATVLLGGLTVMASRRVAIDADRRSADLDALNRELEERVDERTRDLDEARTAAEREKARVEVLLKDINHRIGNNLAMVSALLGMQAAKMKDEEGRAALDAARERVFMIGSAQRRLRLKQDLQSTDIGELLAPVIEDLTGAIPEEARPVVIERYEEVTVDSRDAVTLCVVMSELVTNAVKHAFEGEAERKIWVEFGRGADSVLFLRVADNGRGRAEAPPGDGLGSTVVRQLSRHYGGEIIEDVRDGGGLEVTVTLPRLEPVETRAVD